MANLFKSLISRTISQRVGLPESEIEPMIEIPKDSQMGDYAFPCFKLSRNLKKSPPAIAEELTQCFAGTPEFDKVTGVSGYLNFTVKPERLIIEAIRNAIRAGETIGRNDTGAGRLAIVEYSSPNIAKPFGVGHLRSTVIGNSIARLHRNAGYQVIRINHLGDWGTQFGKLITAYQAWGDEEKLNLAPIQHLYDLYVRFHKAAEQAPSLEETARQWFKRLEDGDSTAQSYWEKFRDLSMREFKKIYQRLGVEFDHYTGEAFYSDKMDDCVKSIEAKGITTVSDGALIVDLSDQKLPPCLLRKSDGATLYATRDLTAAIYRYNQYHFDKNIYVVGSAQILHFQQFFSVLKKMGFDWADHCVHVPFGLILGISTRKGTLVFLENVLDEARDRALSILEDKKDEFDDPVEVADKIAISAIIFQDLSNKRIKDVDFDLEKMISFDGDTGPYLLYTLVRINSIFKKLFQRIPSLKNFEDIRGLVDRLGVVEKFAADERFAADDRFAAGDRFGSVEDCRNEEAINLIKQIDQFESYIRLATEQYEPSILSNYLIELARSFNKFYHTNRILLSETEYSPSRLLVVMALYPILRNGLHLLGIPTIDKM
ncbi:MAG: arginine--tRNA ligase [Candidatus Delongbacteria bacterium]|nr:arginine--tRNA ligase [Candidatus Delongbacteria bacterium]